MTYASRLFSSTLTISFGLGLCLGACTAGEDEGADGDETGESTGGGSNGSGDGDGDAGSGGDGDGTTEDATTDEDCPTGTFDCPCGIGGECAAGLECTLEGLCALGGSETTGMGTTTTDATGLPTGLEPDLYDPEECEAPSDILEVEQVPGSFCSAPCVLDEDCPETNSNADPACVIATMGDGIPNQCALLCYPEPDADDPCPDGSSCKPIPQQPNLGVCTYPE